MALSTIGSIATHLAENFPNIPMGISGNLIEIVDMSRIHVENYTGDSIGSNSISSQYQYAILNFSKADLVDTVYSYGGIVAGSTASQIMTGSSQSFDNLQLEELTVSEGKGANISAMEALGGLTRQASEQFRDMAQRSLEVLPRNVIVGKTLV